MAYACQSMSFGSSPCAYRRCSENSTLNPWKGEACSPAMNPSTMNRARRSSRETVWMTSGLRYLSAGAGMGGSYGENSRETASDVGYRVRFPGAPIPGSQPS